MTSSLLKQQYDCLNVFGTVVVVVVMIWKKLFYKKYF
jgi:hypothetical protein